MKRSSSYKTKQKEELTKYIQSLSKKQFTVNDLIQYLKEDGLSIGTTTIYRHLEKMVQEGVVNKYYVNGSSAYFEYVGEQEKVHKLYRLKCEKCGKLIHFQCSELENVHQHLAINHGFTIDTPKTVFFGICNHCSVSSK